MSPTETPGAIAYCERCKRKLQVAAKRREDSKPFRLAKVPKGVCPECVMTQWLYNTYPVNMQIDIAGPELLLKPQIREAFVASGILSGCDLSIDEINWEWLVANWKLPVKVSKSERNPYRMGEHKEREAARRAAGWPEPRAESLFEEDAAASLFDDATADLRRILRDRRRPN
jgi:hypothetical protein